MVKRKVKPKKKTTKKKKRGGRVKAYTFGEAQRGKGFPW